MLSVRLRRHIDEEISILEVENGDGELFRAGGPNAGATKGVMELAQKKKRPHPPQCFPLFPVSPLRLHSGRGAGGAPAEGRQKKFKATWWKGRARVHSTAPRLKTMREIIRGHLRRVAQELAALRRVRAGYGGKTLTHLCESRTPDVYVPHCDAPPVAVGAED